MAQQEFMLLTLVSLLAIGGMVYSQTTGAASLPIGVDGAWYTAGADLGQQCIEADMPNQADWSKCCSYACEDYCISIGSPRDCQQHCRWSCRNELKKEFSLFYTK